MATAASDADVREGKVEVPGARLRYRLAGAPRGPILIFENGWGASYEMWTWVERELAPHAQLLFYNRAGIGGSELLEPQTVEGLSTQFIALPRALGLVGPIVAVGQSYGGLMCSLHAAQQRNAVLAAIEIDPTPEQSVPELDDSLELLPSIVRVVKIMVKIGLPNLMFGSVGKFLPAEQTRKIMQSSLSNSASLDAGLSEYALLPGIRAAIAAHQPQGMKRLLIGAGTPSVKNGFVTKLLVSNDRSRASFERNRAFQIERGRQNADCEVMSLPYDHGGLVFEVAGAKASCQAILTFLEKLSRPEA